MFVKEKINEMIEIKAWTKYKLAKEAGIAQSTLHDIMSGKKIPNSETLYKISKALNADMNDFFTEDDITNKHDIKLDGEQKELLSKISKLSKEDKELIRNMIERFKKS